MLPQNRARRCLPVAVCAAWLIALLPSLADDVICPNDEDAPDPKKLSVSLTTEYDSKYIFRGVNSLPGSGIVTFDATFELQHFSLDIWQATGLSRSYDEFDFTFSYSRSVGAWTFSGGYINYYTPDDDHLNLGYNDTQEIFASIEYDIGSRFTATLKYNYDFDKLHGGFIEPKFAACFPVLNNKVAFDPYLSIPYDLQYNSNRFAWNHLETGVAIASQLNEKLKITALVAVSVPLAAIDDFAKKEGWGGLRLEFDF